MNRLPRIKRYNKKFDFSYSYGTYPTIDLLKYKPESVLIIYLKEQGLGSDGVDEIIDLCEKNNIKYEFNSRLIDRVSIKENTYVLGVFNKYDMKLEKGNHVVLVNPSNIGNLGTIIRSMKGFEHNNLAIIKPSVDIFDPLVVRSAMGAFFQMNIEYFDSIDEYMQEYSDNNIYSFMLKGSINIKEVVWKSPYSLVFGNESTGLDGVYNEYGQSVYIKHSSNIDSLNLSIAVSIALFNLYNN